MMRLLMIACCLCGALIAPAQAPLHVVPGLPTKEVYDLHVDKKGYLWVGHGLGLSRFDGLNFIHYTHPSQVSLRTTDIVEDRQGRIWYHNFSGQVYYIAKGKIKQLEAYNYRLESQYPRMALCGDELLITSQRGLFVCNTQTLKSRYIYFSRRAIAGTATLAIVRQQAIINDGQNWYQYSATKGLQNLAADAGVMKGAGNTLSLQPQAHGDTIFLTANPSGALQKLLVKNGKLVAVGNEIYNDYINAVTINGQAWIHTRNESFTTNGKQRLKSKNLTDVVVGSEGNQWFGSLREGLMVRHRLSAWKKIQFPVDDADDFIRCLNVGEGYFLAGTQRGNLLVMEQDSGKATWRHNLFNGYGSIEFIRFYKDHRFLVGSSVNTYVVNPREKKIEDLLPLEAILDVDFHAGNLYLATTNGFYLLPYIDSVLNLPGWLKRKPVLLPDSGTIKKGKETFLYLPERTRSVRYNRATQSVFIVSKNGLQQADAQGVRPYYIEGKEVFASSLWYQHPRLYIATINDGLWVKEGERLQHFTTANALFSNTVLRIKVTGRHLWLFQNTGLQVFDTKTDQVLQHIDLPPVEGDNIFDVAEKDGYAYLTTAQGIYKVPMHQTTERVVPKGFLDYVLVNNKDTLGTAAISLPYHKNDVQFFFSSPTFYDPTSVSFRYRLLGADSVWQVTKPGERMLRFSALQPGRYTFEVMAVNKYGNQQPQPIAFRFAIEKPWWGSWWFWGGINLLLLAAIVIAIQSKVKQRLKVELIRRTISSDLHDDIGATLSSVNIYAALARTEKNNAVYLNLIQQHVTDAVTRLDDLVWSINPKNDTMEQLVARMQTTAGSLLQAAGIGFHFECAPKVFSHKLTLTQKRHFYLLYKEMLNNAVKHSGCRNCYVVLEVQYGKLVLRISDDGVGFDPQRVNAGGNGLQNMYARTAKLKGTLDIISASRQGCTLQVKV